MSPGKFGVAVISPPLDDAGNSVRAQRAIADISTALGGNPYAGGQTSEPAQPKSSFEIYGFAMLDIGHDFKQIDPNWFDTLRVTKLPSFENEFGRDNNTFAGVRQSRLGVRSSTPTDARRAEDHLRVRAVRHGVDEGQTTFRLRHAYGELGAVRRGQTWSPFMDPDVFPNSLEYWGPTGMVFFRNVQVRWMPINGETQRRDLALERPGASGDQGVYSDRIELQDIRAALPAARLLRRLQADGRTGATSRAAGILRPSSGTTCSTTSSTCPATRPGGASTSAPTSRRPRATRAAAVRVRRGHPELHERLAGGHRHPEQLPEPLTPILGKPVPIVGIVAFVDHTWNEKFSTPSATRGRTTTTPTARRPTPSGAATTRSATCSTTRRRT